MEETVCLHRLTDDHKSFPVEHFALAHVTVISYPVLETSRAVTITIQKMMEHLHGYKPVSLDATKLHENLKICG